MGLTSFKYTDTLIFNNVGASQFNWQWTGIDGQSNPGRLGGPNLLGANLFMTYDNSQLNQAVTQELNEVNKATLTESEEEGYNRGKGKKVKSNIQTAPVAKINTPSSPVTKTPAATTTNAAPKPTQQVTQKTTTPTATKSNETKKLTKQNPIAALLRLHSTKNKI